MMSENDFKADHVFDGGSMDCGSGLILLIRQNMLQVPAGGLLEIRSTEPTVESELPPWCRMVGHTHVRSDEISPGKWRHFVQRNADSSSDSEADELEADREKARAFKWSVRARRSDNHETTIYSRNFSWKSGASLGFDRSATMPTALEQLLGSLLADVVARFATQCSQQQLLIDELEATVNASLHNTLAAVGVESGDASIKTIALVLFVTSPVASEQLTEVWNASLNASPVFQTLNKACEMDARIVFL
jgi:TusA-related sulfurtransferase